MRTTNLLRLELVPVLQRLPAYSRLAYALIKEPRIRRLHKAILIGGIAYLVSPIDLVPGIVPGLGQLDDLAVVLFALQTTLKTVPAEVALQHMTASGLTWEVLDQDLARIGRSGGILAWAALRFGRRFTSAAGHTVWRLAARALQQR